MSVIAVVGAGLVGRAWSISFARGGYDVRVFDETPGAAERAIAFASQALPMLAREGLLDDKNTDAMVARLSVASSLEAALDGAVHMQESTPESVDMKRQVFAHIDKIAGPDTVLASCHPAVAVHHLDSVFVP